MINLQKTGGVAALIEALAYTIGFVVMATLLNPGDTTRWSTAQKLAYTLDNKALFQSWTLFIYVIFGIVLVVLAAALHDWLKVKSAGVMQIATSFGLIWAGLVIASGMVASIGLETVATLYASDAVQAASAWVAINAVQNGLGGGVEIVGGIWVLLISFAAHRSDSLPVGLNIVGTLVGLAGLLTVVPLLGNLGIVFGLGQIVWFTWLGFIMLHRPIRYTGTR
ncbi:DUF4386 family protein [Chitinivorax sp. B]|uniref:DUF4386 family protein n=1 Tax=Chitinivorax sp. B TaxID=2502235 RepID=UPI0010FA0B0F|nr:DUF4386 family protein [Chitinivorax sp. B]